jgi:hypothetical protein
MGQSIVKADPGWDLYLVWSSVVDAAIGVGDRDTLQAWLLDDPQWAPGVHAAFERADRLGSSDRSVRFAWWDDEFLPVMMGSPDDGGLYHLPRSRLVEYAEALLADDELGAQALLVCWHRIGDPD